MKRLITALIAVLSVCSLSWAEEPQWMMQGRDMGAGMGAEQPLWMKYLQYPECTQFLDDTKAQRRELHIKRFDYFEASRRPDTDPRIILELERDINKLSFDINRRAPMRCRDNW